ncbi:hypothetical protein M5689_001063 [Euphorbia peplus]|nr:hypothetical protein M5689_001063 [Euphorbia peplus]
MLAAPRCYVNFAQWLSLVFLEFEEIKERVSLTCWSIWNQRNEAVWNDRVVHARIALHRSMGLLRDYQQCQASANLQRMTPSLPHVDRWEFLKSRWVKVNIDAATNSEGGRVGLGQVCRDSLGRVITCQSKFYTGTWSVELAETIRLKEAMRWFLSLGVSNVILEMNAKMVVTVFIQTS